MSYKNDSIRVGVYSRVSTQEQVEGTSMEFQDAQLTGYCKLQNWTITNAYTDPGFSGKDGNRPGLERLLSDPQACRALGTLGRRAVLENRGATDRNADLVAGAVAAPTGE